MSNFDVNVDGRTDGRTNGRTEIWTPISHPAISRCDKKMFIQKSLHPQFGHCMANQQLIKSHNIAKYSKKVKL